MPADRKLDWKKARRVLKAQEIRFASEHEVLEHTGCEPGGVPPFGHKNKLAVLVDNAGLQTKSIRLTSEGLHKAFDAQGAAFFDLSN